MECAFKSPVRYVCGMFMMYCMQCCMAMSAVLQCVDVLSRGGIQMFAIMFRVVNVYRDHLRFCVVCIDGRR